MEANGITTAVLSSSPGPEQLEVKKSIEVCAKTNETLYELTKQYSGLYLGSAVLPVNDTDAACRELERCVKGYGFVGWHVHSNFGDTAPDEERYWPIFQKAAELGIYVYLHPQVPDDRRTRNCGFMVAAPMLGFTQDTMTTVTKLMLSGMLDEIPNTRLVLGHLGEAIPFLMARMDNRVQVELDPFVRAKHTLRYYFEHNIMVTTSGNLSIEAFKCTKNVLGIDRICFGTDYPYENPTEVMEFHDELPLSRKEREKLFYQNAEEKLGIRV
ncbi:MAG: amidohydrolase family protein [Lachnospiraceae bacterium]|nr:amidohydrolase family protein [Lachnospiraceae bacterium]